MRKRISALLLSFVVLIGTVGNAYAADRWEIEPNMPNSWAGASVVSYGSQIYQIGGKNGSIVTNEMNIWDTKTGEWLTGRPMLTERYWHSALLVGDTIYVAGGIDGEGNKLTSFEAYDIKADKWYFLESMPIEKGRYYMASSAVGDNLYFIGGALDETTSSKEVNIYNITTSKWTAGPEMEKQLNGASAVVYGHDIYVVGGTNGNWGSSDLSPYLRILDTTTNIWREGADNLSNRFHCQAQIWNGKIYMMGGSTTTNHNISNAVYIYDIAEDIWKTGPSMNVSRTYFYSIVLNGKIYVFSNLNGSNSVESLDVEDRLFVLLDPGEQCQASLTHNLDNNYDYKWSSVDSSIASVDARGLITALSEGKTYIFCTNFDGSYSDYIPVKVREGASEIRLAVHLEKVGESEKLWLSDTDLVMWNSLGPAVADVDSNGVVTAISRGLTVIEGTVNERTYHIYVRVNATS